MSIMAEKQKLKKYNFCASKELEIQRLLKLHKWAGHGQYCFNHVYSGRGESKSQKVNL